MRRDFEVFELGDHPLQSGATLPGARLAFKTYGRLSSAGDNAVLFPTAFGQAIEDNAPRIGAGLALDPERFFIISVALFGNGQSSSPSNMEHPADGPRFPSVTIADNVRAQRRLVAEHLGLKALRLVIGCSMGGLQAFQWGALYPEMVERIAPIVSAARCSRHNYVFLAGLKAALTTDPLWNGGDFASKPSAGLRAFGRVYAGWAFSQAFYRDELDKRALGYPSVDAFLEGFWDTAFQEQDPNDLLAMLWTWQHADISANERFSGDFDGALAAIAAKALVMPCLTDLYFPVEDNISEVAKMHDATCVPIRSVWGHLAGSPTLSSEDAAFVNLKLSEFLS